MIEILSDINDLLKTGNVFLYRAKLKPPDVGLYAVRVDVGRALLEHSANVPIIDGKAVVRHFAEGHTEKYKRSLIGSNESIGKIADSAFISGTPNYYHFLVTHLPSLILLSAEPRPMNLTMVGMPKAFETFLPKVLPVLSTRNDVKLNLVSPGIYDVQNAVFPLRPPTVLPAHVCRHLVLPLVLGLAGVADPLREMGPLKLFVRRENSSNGRNLINQAEVESWFLARGYTSVNPGAFTFEEQVLLFSRATHIARVEGAAMTNMLFAVNAKQVSVIASPKTGKENFFKSLAEHHRYDFKTIFGHVDADSSGAVKRSTDFYLAMEALNAVVDL